MSQTGFTEQFLEIFLVGVQFTEKLFDGLGVRASGTLSPLHLLLTLVGRLAVRDRRLLRLLNLLLQTPDKL